MNFALVPKMMLVSGPSHLSQPSWSKPHAAWHCFFRHLADLQCVADNSCHQVRKTWFQNYIIG